MNPTNDILCKHYCINEDYQGHQPGMTQEIVDFFFEREVRFLEELQYLSCTPKLLKVDRDNNKVFIDKNSHYPRIDKLKFNAEHKLSTSKITDKSAKTKNKGNDCLRLSLARATLSERGVMFDVFPPVYVHSKNGTLCNEKLILKKR